MEVLNYQRGPKEELYWGEAALTAAAVTLLFQRVQPSLKTATAVGVGCMLYTPILLGGMEVKPINDYGLAFAGPIAGLQFAALGWGLMKMRSAPRNLWMQAALGLALTEAIGIKGLMLPNILSAS